MNPNILHVGLDVDDTQYHGSAFNRASGEIIDFRCRPTLKGLLTQLDKLQRHFRGLSIRLCYEASYVGYCLQRDLRAHGVHCDVVAPSSIPSPRGKDALAVLEVRSKHAVKSRQVQPGSGHQRGQPLLRIPALAAYRSS